MSTTTEHRPMPVWQSFSGQRYCDRFALHGEWVGWPCNGEAEMASDYLSPTCLDGDHDHCYAPTCACTKCDCGKWVKLNG